MQWSGDRDGVIAQTGAMILGWQAVSTDGLPDRGAGITGGANREKRARRELQVSDELGAPETVPSDPAGPVDEKREE